MNPSSEIDTGAIGPSTASATAREDIDISDVFAALAKQWKLVLAAPLAASVLALGASYLISPTFTAQTSFLLPQQQQGGAASALASLGALAGAAGSIKSTGDQYVAMIRSTTIANRMIDRFELMKVYDRELRIETRLELSGNTRVNLGKKDGLITVEVDDHDAKRSAAMADAYVQELRLLSGNLALTEAKQRRIFFETQLRQVRDALTVAQRVLQGVGINAGAIKAEPKATFESYAKLKAEITASEVRLQVLRGGLSDNTPEVQRALATVSALRSELAKLEQTVESNGSSSYVGAYREYKYQEALFDLIARQFELAKVDESRDGGQLQVIDEAQIPERKSKPKRSLFVLAGFGIGLIAASLLVLRRLFSTRSSPRAPAA